MSINLTPETLVSVLILMAQARYYVRILPSKLTPKGLIQFWYGRIRLNALQCKT